MAIPLFAGTCERSWLTASSPPAEAPTATTGNTDGPERTARPFLDRKSRRLRLGFIWNEMKLLSSFRRLETWLSVSAWNRKRLLFGSPSSGQFSPMTARMIRARHRCGARRAGQYTKHKLTCYRIVDALTASLGASGLGQTSPSLPWSARGVDRTVRFGREFPVRRSDTRGGAQVLGLKKRQRALAI
jgi:hypothetical protein